MPARSFILIFFASVALSVADAFFKALALQNLEGVPATGSVFSLYLHKNPGIAFGLPLPLLLTILLSSVLLGALAVYIYRSYQLHPYRAGFAFMTFAGAVNNFADRLLHGFTTDYLLFFARSAINLSDILIVVGAIFLFVYTQKEA